jgi:hypothetical protein
MMIKSCHSERFHHHKVTGVDEDTCHSNNSSSRELAFRGRLWNPLSTKESFYTREGGGAQAVVEVIKQI